jgi:NAD(P)-dependent dehydrogenase (short-subunit alcohol dehydrogenase family)
MARPASISVRGPGCVLPGVAQGNQGAPAAADFAREGYVRDTAMGIMGQFRLDGRRALVTGAPRGIGKSIALALAECGANVVINYASSRELAEQAAAEAAAFGVSAHAIQAELGKDGAAQKLYEQSVAALGGIDILVHNASVQYRRAWTEIPGDEFDHQIAVNLKAMFELTQLAVPPMCDRGWGRVLMIGSVQQMKPSPMMMVYAGTKQAQLSMARNLAMRVGPFGVTVNNLAPGAIDTFRNVESFGDPANIERLNGRIPLGRVGQPDDCAAAALLLCSDAGQYITGADLFVDGGLSII